MITEDYVSFEIAKLLKEKGFNCVSKAWYAEYTSQFGGEKYLTVEFDDYNRFNDNYKFICYRPTLQIARKWLEKNHNLYIDVYPVDRPDNFFYGIYKFCDTSIVVVNNEENNHYTTSEDAYNVAIKYCLENLI